MTAFDGFDRSDRSHDDASFGLTFLSPDNTLHRINGLTSPDQAETWMATVQSQLRKHQPRNG